MFYIILKQKDTKIPLPVGAKPEIFNKNNISDPVPTGSGYLKLISF